jgi:phosphoribosylaminoimidazolecarboxamide formyltransferase|tara:strand:+ start:14503 stop:15492 length:990 start_codon:yes stop_codon:yes gene_type:complete
MDSSQDDFPASLTIKNDHYCELRYGENPHQTAALYADPTVQEANVVSALQLNPTAKELSYNNYNDSDGALNLIKEFKQPAAAIIKHANPAGCAVAKTISEAYAKALSTDPMSAFGGVVALNQECDVKTAEQIVSSFKEVVVAPSYTEDSLNILRTKKNLRILSVGELNSPSVTLVEKPIVGGRLIQQRDLNSLSSKDLQVVTKLEPTPAQIETMLFAWKVVKHVKSNAIVFATGTETVGLGMGQVSRVDAVRLASIKAVEHSENKTPKGAIMASDAFFPFPDALENAAEAGISAVIQPGGSINDDAVIDAANNLDISMVFTGTRCFKHD